MKFHLSELPFSLEWNSPADHFSVPVNRNVRLPGSVSEMEVAVGGAEPGVEPVPLRVKLFAVTEVPLADQFRLVSSCHNFKFVLAPTQAHYNKTFYSHSKIYSRSNRQNRQVDFFTNNIVPVLTAD